MMNIIWFFILAACAAGSGKAAERAPVADASELPRIPALSPARAIQAMQVRPGFHVKIAAAEPDVLDPVAVVFDENGRMFVLELPEYNSSGDRSGRVRMLEDRDNDGRYERSTVFADHLQYPTAIMCWNGGVLVGATPDLIFFKDNDGDGRADTREVKLTGFGGGDLINATVMSFNSLQWGFDNRIYGEASLNSGKVRLPGEPEASALDLTGHDFSFDPRFFAMRLESGTAQWGMTFDDIGRRFVSTNHDHIRILMYEDRYAARNPHFAMPPPLVNVAADKDRYAAIYRISPDEPWRVLRTKWRATGLARGPVEGGGQPSGYFTAACGITIYRGDAFPAEFKGNAFIAEPAGNLVHRKLIRLDGLETVAERAPDEQTREFIASRDLWFRPVAFANAPDGALYVVDMSRETIELGRTMPDGIRQHLDLASGIDRGRIYRVEPDGFARRPAPRLGAASVAELVTLLDHPNGWHSETAARLIYERQDKSAIAALDKMAVRAAHPVARIRALYALDGLGALEAGAIERSLGDPAGEVRAQAIRLAERLRGADAALSARLVEMAGDAEPLVRYQAAFTLGELNPKGKTAALVKLARGNAESSWMLAAVGSSLAPNESRVVFSALKDDASFRSSEAGRDFLRQLLVAVGAEGHATEAIADVAAFLDAAGDPEMVFSALESFGRGLRRAKLTLAEVDPQGLLQPHIHEAARVAENAKARESRRLAAIELLGFGASATVQPALLRLIVPNETPRIQVAATRVLARLKGADVAPLIARWPQFAPQQRAEALNVLLGRPDRALALIEAVAANQIPRVDLSATQVGFLKSHDDPKVRAQANAVLAAPSNSSRQAVIANYAEAFALSADAKRGHAVYARVCSACHRIGREGSAVGPDLVVLKSAGKEALLTSILDPNRDVAPNYLFYTVTTKDNESILGAIARETPASVTLRQPFGGEVVVQRANVARIARMDQSFMPEGLEGAITKQEMADLLEFLVTLD